MPMVKLPRVRKSIADRVTEPVVQLLATLPISPNAITWLGFLLAVGAGALIATGHLVAAGVTVLFAGFFDILDGALARQTNRTTRFGGILDSTLDRLSEAVLLIGVLLHIVDQSPVAVLLVFLALLGSLLVSYIRARAEALRVSLTEPLDAILSSTGRLVPYDVAEITLWDEERGCCVTRGWGGDAAYAWESGGEYRIDEGYTGWLIQHQHLLFIPDVQARRDVRPKFDSPAYPFRSYIGIPLQVRGEFVGTLELASYQKDVWSERDLEVLWAVADQAAVSIGNARLYAQADEELRRREETLRRRNRELAVLYEAATATGSSLSLDAVLQTVADQMTRVLNSKGCALSLWDRARNVIETLVDYSTRWAEPAGTVYDLNDYPATLQVLETRQPMVIQRDDPTTDEAELALMREQGIRTLLMLPLIAGDRVLGLVELIDEAEAVSYTHLTLPTN